MSITDDNTFFCCIAAIQGHEEMQGSNISMWQRWNSAWYQQARKNMLDKGADFTCTNGDPEKFKCVTAHKNTYFHEYAKTDLQRANIAKAQESFNNKELSVSHYPVFLLLTLGYKCNLNCIHCGQGNLRTHKEDMDIDEYVDELKEFLKRACIVQVIGGEPTLYKSFYKILDIVDEDTAKIWTVTNGHFLNRLIKYADKLQILSVSIDASNEQEYSIMRHSSSGKYDYSHLIKTIEEFMPHKGNIQMIANHVFDGRNFKSSRDIVRQAHRLGFDTVDLCETFSPEHYNYHWIPLKEQIKIFKHHFQVEEYRLALEDAVDEGHKLGIQVRAHMPILGIDQHF